MVDQLAHPPTGTAVLRLALATALGLFLGLEREWSHKSAGIRTFALISLLGAVVIMVGSTALLVVGGVLIILQGLLLTIEGILDEEGLSLTTAVSMLVAYGIGLLVGQGLLIEGITVAVISSALLVLKRELHSFAWGLSREEIRSTTEFAVLAGVIFPLLPSDPVSVEVAALTVEVDLRIIWLMVVTVSAIGIVNYVIVQTYGSRGIAVTGFFGGLASSTAVVGALLDHVRQRPSATSYGVAAILLADAAMALRNLAIAVVFTATGVTEPLWLAGGPLGAVILTCLVVAYVAADWSEATELELDSPFSLRYALLFGLVFLLIVVIGGLAQAQFGDAGLYTASGLTGFVSSAGATTSAVLLYRGEAIGATTATVAILAATAASIVTKAVLTAAGPNRELTRRVATWSLVVLLVGVGATASLTII